MVVVSALCLGTEFSHVVYTNRSPWLSSKWLYCRRELSRNEAKGDGRMESEGTVIKTVNARVVLRKGGDKRG